MEIKPYTKTRTAHEKVSPSRLGPYQRGIAYEGWKRNPYAQAWFDSTPELTAANAIDDADDVQLWVRLHRNDLPILWTNFNEYNPDFVVLETDGPAWVVEIKSDSGATTDDVKKKAEMARRWANAVSVDEKVGRDWKYLFLTETHVEQAKGSWSAMKSLGT